MLLVFEGVDGCGKTTQLNLLHRSLAAQGHRTLTLSNPEDSGLLTTGYLSAHATALFRAAALRQLNDTVIWPLISRGMGFILLERGCHNPIAYQGYGDGLLSRVERIAMLNATEILRNAVTIYLRIPEAEARRRCPTKQQAPEFVKPGYLQRVIHGFDAIAAQERWHAIDGAFPAEDVHRSIMQFIALKH